MSIIIQWCGHASFRIEGGGIVVYIDPWKLDRKVRTEPFFCRSGISFASVLADGSITGCSNNAPDFIQGNIRDDDLKKVWEKGFGVYRDRENLRKGICRTCPEFRRCGGGSLHLWKDRESGPAFCYLEALKS